MRNSIQLDLIAVIVAVTDGQPRVLTVPHADTGTPDTALPAGTFDPLRDRTLELALRDWIRRQAGLEVGYVEQLYTFADLARAESRGPMPGRLVSVAYLALVRETLPAPATGAAWRDMYGFFPWEDHREGTPALLTPIRRALQRWRGSDPALRQRRRERVEIAFGLGSAGWDGYLSLERYELLYEAGLVPEAQRDRGLGAATSLPGEGMALDHRRILATALGRLRGKLKYRPVVFELLPEQFTLLQLQRVVEALSGVRLHKQNFRRLVAGAGLVEGTGHHLAAGRGRPAELFRFRREVLRERQGPGVRLPVARTRPDGSREPDRRHG